MAVNDGDLARCIVFHTVLTILLIVSYFSSSLNSFEVEPSLQVFIPVHSYSHSKILPFTLTAIEQQEYPKDRISIHIKFDLYLSVSDSDYDEEDERFTRNWLTFNQIKEWISCNNASYHAIQLDMRNISNDVDSLDGSEEYWDEKRIVKMMRSRDFALNKAKNSWAEYLLFIDSDVVLVDQKTFRHLIETELPIISPKLASLEESPDDLVHSCVLIDLMIKPVHQIRFENPEWIHEHFGDWIAFAESARENHLPIHVEKSQVFGYIMPPVRSNMDLTEFDQDLIDLELKSVYGTRKGFPLSEKLFDYLERPQEDSLDVDKIYIINLKRDQERYQVMSKRMEIMGIKAHFSNATDENVLTDSFLKDRNIRVIPSSSKTQYWGIKSSGQIANFLSHYDIWMDMVEQDYKRVIIFEDDVIFVQNFKNQFYELLGKLEAHEDEFGETDLIYLGRESLDKTQDTSTNTDGLVTPCPSLGAYGYILTRTGAVKLLESNPMDKIVPVDEYFMALSGRHPLKSWMNIVESDLQILSVDPCLVKPDNLNGDSHFTAITSQGRSIDNPQLYSNYLETLVRGYRAPDPSPDLGIAVDSHHEVNLVKSEANLNPAPISILSPEPISILSANQGSMKDKLGVDEVYVINLDRRQDRRLKMTQRLEEIGVEAKFWPAVDGKSLEKDSSLFERITVMPEFIDHWGSSMSFGEIGCFFSHYQVWLDSIENGYEQILIIEDDATFVDDFKDQWTEKLEAIEELESIDGPVDLVYLGRKLMDHDSEEETQVPGLDKPGFSWWTIGYLIKRSGIEKIIASNPMEKLLPVDDFLSVLSDQFPCEDVKGRFPERNLKTFSVDPLLVYPEAYTGDDDYISDTEDSKYFESPHQHSDL